jgi:PAS domain S-box-containing protein
VIADPDGNAVRLVGTTQNVTRLRRSESRLQESEERLRLILDSVMDHAIITQTAEGIVTGWNPGAVNTFGYQPDEIIGQPIDVLFTPEDRAAGVPQDEMNTARSVGRAEDERWHMRKDGSRFYASGVLSPLRGGPNTGFVKVARDLTAKQKAEEELRRAREELEVRVRERTRELNESNKALRQEVAERVKSEEARVGLLRRIVTTQEDERGRIARDLHDQLGQRLTALRLKIASLRSVCGENEELHKRVENLEAIGARLDAEVSFLAWELRPRALDDLGLATAVENFVTEWSNHFDIPAEFHSTGLTEQRFEPEIETNLYRITQEALNNVFKHAKATNASVILERRGDEVILVVEDNGKGFEADARGSNMLDSHTGRGLGLVGMSERAAIVGGSLEIESSEGSGTTVFVRVPARYADSGGANGK